MRLIDADALSCKVRESMYDNPHTDSMVRRTHIHEHDCILRTISLEPTIDAVPVVHGRWIDADYWTSVNGRSIHYISKQCSICHKNVRRKSELPYCPNCGARMDGDGNG